MSRELTNSSSYGSSATEPESNFSGFNQTYYVSLSESVAQNIGTIKSSWKQLEKAFKIVGTAKDNLNARDKV